MVLLTECNRSYYDRTAAESSHLKDLPFGPNLMTIRIFEHGVRRRVCGQCDANVARQSTGSHLSKGSTMGVRRIPQRILAIQWLNTEAEGGVAKSLSPMLHHLYFLAFCRPHEVLALPMIASFTFRNA